MIGIKPKNPELFFDFPNFKKNIKEISKYTILNNPHLESLNFEIRSLQNKIKKLYSEKLPSLELQRPFVLLPQHHPILNQFLLQRY